MENSTLKKKITLGIFAHVDAGKTTLAEAVLFLSGKIRVLGRVDHKDTYLDTYELERKRGITIFSKEAGFDLNNTHVTLIDTPGHVDFAEEAERTLSVLDAAVLVVSGTNLVESHTITLWSLLKRYHIPVFVFVNKMDISTYSHKEIMANLAKRLDGHFADFTEKDHEEISLASEHLMNAFLENGMLSDEEIFDAVNERQVFPVYFGSALKLTGVEELLTDIDTLTPSKYEETDGPLAARVYKITRDKTGVKLSHVKLLSGSIKIKSEINNEKLNQIRFISGDRYELREEAFAGDVCALAGLKDTFAGQLIGEGGDVCPPILAPVMTSRLILPVGTDVINAYKQLSEIAEELPEISLSFIEETSEIQVMIMGEVQMEILKHLIKSRLSMDIDFGPGAIIYKETITGVSEGIGHFEPLRHYAEVHLKLEPGERGSGITVDTDVSEDLLDLNFQRLIMTHVTERRHRGVLTGAGLTDVRITVVGGRSHPKHTEGGDFRQATYRAVRCGLLRNSSVLLEPYYAFELDIPMECMGRALTDIPQMSGSITSQEIVGERARIYGRCPVATLHGYALTVVAYTKGEGSLSVSNGGFDICHNTSDVIAEKHYDYASDIRNTPDSVFCANGSGFIVPWNEVEDYMHVPLCVNAKPVQTVRTIPVNLQGQEAAVESKPSKYSYSASVALDKELSAIFNKTYSGKKQDPNEDLFYRNRTYNDNTHASMKEDGRPSDTKRVNDHKPPVPKYLLVDGYNIIFSWDELNELSRTDLQAARQALVEKLCNYKGYTDYEIILVFDAYKVSGGQEHTENVGGIYVVFTKEAEIADRYIERTTKQLVKKAEVTVATSDATEQVIIWSAGALRMSAPDLHKVIAVAEREIAGHLSATIDKTKDTFFDTLSMEEQNELSKKRLK